MASEIDSGGRKEEVLVDEDEVEEEEVETLAAIESALDRDVTSNGSNDSKT
jgi:hypothetical protein